MFLEERREAINHPDGWSIAAGRHGDESRKQLQMCAVWKARPALKSAFRGPRTEVLARDLRCAAPADAGRIVALQAGFSDISQFNRLFRARFGDTPSAVGRGAKE
jgi:hypothetical protein